MNVPAFVPLPDAGYAEAYPRVVGGRPGDDGPGADRCGDEDDDEDDGDDGGGGSQPRMKKKRKRRSRWRW